MTRIYISERDSDKNDWLWARKLSTGNMEINVDSMATRRRLMENLKRRPLKRAPLPKEGPPLPSAEDRSRPGPAPSLFNYHGWDMREANCHRRIESVSTSMDSICVFTIRRQLF
jgi:hypothetical protein